MFAILIELSLYLFNYYTLLRYTFHLLENFSSVTVGPPLIGLVQFFT